MARVATLMLHGIWPGIYRVKHGWALTYDPVIAEEEAGF